jgi:hypothetical protein
MATRSLISNLIRVDVQEVRPELVEGAHELVDRLRRRERQQSVDAHVEGLRPAPAHVGRRAATDHREPRPRDAGPQADPLAPPQEHREDGHPAGPVVDEQRLAA